MKKIILLIFIYPYFVYAQNLIVNPDFTKTSKNISENVDYEEGLRGFGTVDFYHPSAGVYFPWNIPPNTFTGFSYPLFGDGFGGFINYSFKDGLGNIRSCFEHIQFSFKDTLVKNKKYNISFYLKLSNYNDYSGKNIGMLFSKDSNFVSCFEASTSRFIDYSRCLDAKSKADIEINNLDKLVDTSWTEITAIYRARGGEQYMTIGVFWQDNAKIIKANNRVNNRSSSRWINNRRSIRFAKTLKRKLLVKNEYKTHPITEWNEGLNKELSGFAYYFIDCVSITPVEK